MILEIFVSFIVLFAVFALIVFNVTNYNRPMGFDYEKVWSISFNLGNNERDSIINYYGPVNNLLKSMPEIEESSWTGANFPFSNSNSNTDIEYNKIKIMSDFHRVGDDFQKVINASMAEGRWFGKQDNGLKNRPIVINQTLKDQLFKNESPIGKVVSSEFEKTGQVVIGVVADFKDKGDFQRQEASYYRRIDTSGNRLGENSILIKLRSPQDATFEAKLQKELSKVVRGANIEIDYLAGMRKSKNSFTIIPLIIFLIVSGFLILNVSLGLFGILWYNINKRRSEIGLRRAVGATGVNISWYFMAEALVLTTLALIVGFFFAVQFPLLNVFDVSAGVYLTAIVFAALFIYILVLICSFYPGKQAAGIYPAVALHED
jgi:putative ABC transport system permease protein